MITFEHRILSEYRIKQAKIDTLSNSIRTNSRPKSTEAKEASDFLDVIIRETDRFYAEHGNILSSNGKRLHPLSQITEKRQWKENREKFYEKNPRRRQRLPK